VLTTFEEDEDGVVDDKEEDEQALIPVDKEH